MASVFPFERFLSQCRSAAPMLRMWPADPCREIRDCRGAVGWISFAGRLILGQELFPRAISDA